MEIDRTFKNHGGLTESRKDEYINQLNDLRKVQN